MSNTFKINGILLGILLGMLIVMAAIFCYRKIIVPSGMTSLHMAIDTSHVVKKKDFFEHINTVKAEQLAISERVASINRRVDDLIVFGGIIVTLLLAINVSVYIRADAEVAKHFKANFAEHKQKADAYLAEIALAAEKVRSEFSLINQQRSDTLIQTIPDDGRSGEPTTHA